MTRPSLSVVIPGYNRPEPLKATLCSVADAAVGLPPGSVEVLLIDDGSTPPLLEQLGGFEPGIGFAVHRQLNSGSIVARQHGLDRATGEFIQFLDSDDLVHPEKFVRQLAAHQAAGADVSYVDVCEAAPGADYRATDFRPLNLLPVVDQPADLFIRVQPVPHSPIYRRSYLASAFSPPAFAASRLMDPAGDVWFFYNLAVRPARIVKVDGPLAVVGLHATERFSQHWETLAVSALLIVEKFMQATASTPTTLPARRAAGAVAFESWRRLPWDFSPAFRARLLAVWRQSSPEPTARRGGRFFSAMARVLGPVPAGWLLRRLRGSPYAKSRTMPAAELARLLATAGIS